MKNKINGIDVSECPLYEKKTGCYHTFNGECVKDSCVVYKWLLEYKRLQEENEKLKADLKGETEQCQKWYQLETDKHLGSNSRHPPCK